MTAPSKKRKPIQHSLGNLPDHLERFEQVIEPDSIIFPCGCGDMVRIGDGRGEMDSNVIERAIRPIALNRNNALFAGHDEGGRTWARIASLIEACKLNNVEPYANLKPTLEAIAAGHPAARIHKLMPWYFDKHA